MPKTPALDVSNLNPNVLRAEYAVRGAIAVKAQAYAEKMRQGEDLGFESIVQCNIGRFIFLKTREECDQSYCIANHDFLCR